jgi:ribosomal protein S18 acetylase RimI-like enzyme
MLAIVKQHETLRFHGSLLDDVLVDLKFQRGFVAVSGSEIVGFVSCSSGDGVPCVTYVGVIPARSRGGLGTRLVETAANEALVAGAPILRVVVMGWTRPYNKQTAGTRHFYKSLGFETVKKHPIRREDNGDQWRLYTLEKALATM